MSISITARPHQGGAFLSWLAVSAITGAVGALATQKAASFYVILSRPVWAPPAWLFGPVWTALYLMMGVAAWLVWRTTRDREARTHALQLFVLQLVLNALWSWLFFAWRQGAAAFVEIVLLWACIAFTMRAFARIDRTAALLLAPYLAWVTFATALTWTLWRANPMVLG